MKMHAINLRNISLSTLVNYLALLQILIYLVYRIQFNPTMLAVFVSFIPINIICMGFLYRKNIKRTDIILFIIVVVSFLTSTYLSASIAGYKYSSLLIAVNTFFIAILFRGLLSLKLIFYLNLVCNIAVFTIGSKSGFDPNFGNTILNTGSRNIVSASLIFGILYYLFLCFKLDSKINLPLVVLFYLNCLILFGRSGIALASLILIYTLYKKFGNLISIFLALILTALLSTVQNIVVNKTNFGAGLDTPRIEFYKEYLTGMSYKELLFGRDFEQCCSLITYFDANPHSAFIAGHNFYGLSHILLFSFILVIIVLSRKIELIFFALIFYIRNALDLVGFFTPYDVGLFAIFIYAYRDVFSTKKNKKYI